MKIKKITGSRGVSLLEVLLSIALIAILALISVPVYMKTQVKNDLSQSVIDISQSLRRAQILSQAVDGDSPWGVKISSGTVTVFKGTSFAARDSNFDENFSIPGNIVITGISEVVFSKLTGIPQQSGTLTLTNVHNESRNISINPMGMVDY